MDPRVEGHGALTSDNGNSVPTSAQDELTRAAAASLAFHIFMGVCAGACVLTGLELYSLSPDGYTDIPRFRSYVIYTAVIGFIYLGDFVAWLLGADASRLASVRVALLFAYFSLTVFVGTYMLGWHTYAMTAAIFSNILICIVYSAKWAYLSLG